MKYRNIYCDECYGFNIHTIIDNNENHTQNITCLTCDKKTINQIITKRVKINQDFYNTYINRRKNI